MLGELPVGVPSLDGSEMLQAPPSGGLPSMGRQANVDGTGAASELIVRPQRSPGAEWLEEDKRLEGGQQ